MDSRPRYPEYHVAGRRAGKTTRMILWLAENPNALMLSPNKQMQDHALSMARDMGLDHVVTSRRMILPDQMSRGQVRGDTKLGVDNLEFLLDRWVKYYRIDRATLSGTLVDPEDRDE